MALIVIRCCPSGARGDLLGDDDPPDNRSLDSRPLEYVKSDLFEVTYFCWRAWTTATLDIVGCPLVKREVFSLSLTCKDSPPLVAGD